MFALIVLVSSMSYFTKRITDKEVLIKIYETMNGPEWKEPQCKNWLSDKPIGEWYGVKTNDEGRVISLGIIGHEVSGLIPAEIGRLTELEWLVIYSRVENSPKIIPKEIGKLRKLNHLSISVFSAPAYGLPQHQNISTLVNLDSLYLNAFYDVIP